MLLPFVRFLLKNDGLFIGSSSAMNCVGAVRVAKLLGPGHTIVTILCDSGMRHLSKFCNPGYLSKYGLTPSAKALEFLDVKWVFVYTNFGRHYLLYHYWKCTRVTRLWADRTHKEPGTIKPGWDRLGLRRPDTFRTIKWVFFFFFYSIWLLFLYVLLLYNTKVSHQLACKGNIFTICQNRVTWFDRFSWFGWTFITLITSKQQ